MIKCSVLILSNNSSQAMEHEQPLLITAKRDKAGDLKVRIGDLLGQIKRPIFEKVRNYMVSYFCHKMKSFVYIGHNIFSNTEILAEKM